VLIDKGKMMMRKRKKCVRDEDWETNHFPLNFNVNISLAKRYFENYVHEHAARRPYYVTGNQIGQQSVINIG
jgi:hypothetical protein